MKGSWIKVSNPNGNPQNLIPFRPGQSGNPGGKPLYARNRLSGSFLAELADDFEQHGRAAIQACREQSPSRYLAIVASILPKQIKLEEVRDKTVQEMTTEELEAEVRWCRQRELEQEQFEKDWYASQSTRPSE